MKKTVILALLALIGFTSSSTAEVLRFELDIKDFNELKVTEGINVIYKNVPDSVGKAVYYATPEMASVLLLTNKKSKLELQISTDGIAYNNIPTVTVYSRFLKNVENSGDSTVRVLSIAPCPMLKAKVIGNGRLEVNDVNTTDLQASLSTGNGLIEINGKCENAKLHLTGTGYVNAGNLKSRFANCRLMGTGTIDCNVREELVVGGAGTGSINYKGSPKEVKNKLNIGVKIRNLDASAEDPKTEGAE